MTEPHRNRARRGRGREERPRPLTLDRSFPSLDVAGSIPVARSLEKAPSDGEEGHKVSIARLCRWFGVPRSSFCYRPQPAGRRRWRRTWSG